jgi:hypothetical protein
MNRAKVIIESNDLEEPMVFENLLTFACVGTEIEDSDNYNTIKFWVGIHNPNIALATALALTQMLDELFNYVKENCDTQTFNDFISRYGAEMNQMTRGRDKGKTV